MRPLLVALLLLPVLAFADDFEYRLIIRDHQFEPVELRVPAGKKVRLVVENQDQSAEEFDSHALNREKVIPANSTAPVYIGPLSPGRYPFIGEFHSNTANGVVVAE